MAVRHGGFNHRSSSAGLAVRHPADVDFGPDSGEDLATSAASESAARHAVAACAPSGFERTFARFVCFAADARTGNDAFKRAASSDNAWRAGGAVQDGRSDAADRACNGNAG